MAVGALLFHGLAEELVWRGFALGQLRRSRSWGMAVAWSMPLIALTHVPILIGNGVVVAVLAVVTAAVTCVPFAYLWERGGRTIWGPAILHGLIGWWQLFERSYPMRFQLVVLLTSIAVPPLALIFGDRTRVRWFAGITATVVHGGVGLLVAASTLIMPVYAVLLLAGLWLGGAGVLIRWRRHPARLAGVPVAVLAAWLLGAWAGDTFLGWTA